MWHTNLVTGIIIITVLLVELILQYLEEKNKSRLKDMYTDIIVGIIFVAIGFSFRGTLLIILDSLREFSPFKIVTIWYHWIIIFVILDLVHYLVHYMEHHFRIFWAIHSIHHSSEHYNFSTAIRGPLGTSIYLMLYGAPLCLLGFDPFHVIMVDQIIVLYAFFIHTERIKKLGVLEYFMNTPSHHRVHHSSNEAYIDKNYGACLIIWDKLFGTFIEEETKPIYGLTTPLKTSNPIGVITNEWLLIFKDLARTKKIMTWIRILFNKPGWKPTERIQTKIAIHHS